MKLRKFLSACVLSASVFFYGCATTPAAFAPDADDTCGVYRNSVNQATSDIKNGPIQSAIAGALLGAATGAAIGAIFGGGRGAARGALSGVALGAVGGYLSGKAKQGATQDAITSAIATDAVATTASVRLATDAVANLNACRLAQGQALLAQMQDGSLTAEEANVLLVAFNNRTTRDGQAISALTKIATDTSDKLLNADITARKSDVVTDDIAATADNVSEAERLQALQGAAPGYKPEAVASSLQFETPVQVAAARPVVAGPTTLFVQKARVNIRPTPGLDQPAIGSLTRGASISALGQAKGSDNNEWAQIGFPSPAGEFGYVSMSLLGPSAPPPPSLPAPVARDRAVGSASSTSFTSANKAVENKVASQSLNATVQKGESDTKKVLDSLVQASKSLTAQSSLSG